MSSINTMEITEPPKFKTPKNISKSVSEYQKRNPEKCNEKTLNYYKRMKADPERYAKFLERHKNHRKMKKQEKQAKNTQPPEQ